MAQRVHSPRPLVHDLGRRVLRSNLLGALAYPHGVDRYVELLRPMSVSEEVRAELTGVRHQTAKSVTLTLRPNENWRGMRAGQFVNLSVVIDGVRETRPYSPAGSQHERDGALELTVSTHPEGKVSRFLRNCAKPGTIVGLSQAEGAFTLPRALPDRVLLISGGSGITPVMAILRTLCGEGFTGQIGFLNYARSPELALYGPELEALSERNANVGVARVFTRSGATPNPRFCSEHALAAMSDYAGAATFVCGPPALIEAVRGSWAAEGLDEPAVEMFTATPMRLDLDHAEGTVTFTESRCEAANSGLPLLEQAEDAGLLPDHGCRMGICNTCSARKRSGVVRNIVTGQLSGAGEEQVRICVSVPVGDVALAL